MRLRFAFTKRKKILLTSALLTVALWVIEYFTIPILFSISALVILGYVITYWVLDFDLKGQEYIAFPLLTISFAIALFFISPLFGELFYHWIKIPISYIGFYLIFLTTNILNISTIKPLPLVRAAWTSLHLIYFGLSFLLFSLLFWVPLYPVIIIGTIFLITFFLSYPAYYLLLNELARGGHPFFYMLFTGLLMAELSFIMTFIEVPFYVKALILGGSFYIISGLIEHDLRGNLRRNVTFEYAAIAVLLSAILLAFLFKI